MAKKFDDVIMPEGRRKSIRDIPIPESRRTPTRRTSTDSINLIKKPSPLTAPSVERIAPSHPPISNYSHIPPVPPPRHPSKPRSRRMGLWLAGFLGVLILGVATLSFFDGATLTYTPKSQALEFAGETFTAKKAADSGLLYSVVKLSGEKSEAVSAQGETQVSRKASGVIVVFNDNAEAQKLVENTRFESPTGKIYRINKPITIPGKNGNAPGSVDATVYADAPGDTYNSGPTDFTLPGLKGSAKYKTVYARSKGAISGGFVGMEKAVSNDDLAKAETSLKTALSNELIAKAQAEVPGDFILFPALASVTFESLPQSASGEGDKVNVNIKGNLIGIMFKRADLASALAKNKVALKSDELVSLPKLDTLNVTFAGTPPADLLSISEIAIKVVGSVNLLWETDEVALKSDLLGRSKDDLDSVLRNYPTIASASTTIRPFWKRSLPKSADKVTIKRLSVE